MESIAVITASELSIELSQEWFCKLIFCKIFKKQDFSIADFSIAYWDSIFMRCYIYHMQDLSEMLLKCLNIIRKCLAEFAMWNQYHNNCNWHFFVIRKIIYCMWDIISDMRSHQMGLFKCKSPLLNYNRMNATRTINQKLRQIIKITQRDFFFICFV
jgi:hypothetical protein